MGKAGDDTADLFGLCKEFAAQRIVFQEEALLATPVKDKTFQHIQRMVQKWHKCNEIVEES